MSVYDYDQLRAHIGHRIVCVCYGVDGSPPENVSLECETCNEVLLDFDREVEHDPKETVCGCERCQEIRCELKHGGRGK